MQARSSAVVLGSFFVLAAAGPLVACEANSSSSPDMPVGMVTPPGPASSVNPPATTATAPDAGVAAAPDEKAWGPAVEISSHSTTSARLSPVVGVDATGSAVAVWLETVPDQTRNAVWASRYDAAGAGAWSAPVTIDNPIGNCGAPRIAITPAGTAVAAFTQSATNQGGEQYLVASRFSGSWGAPATISSPGQGPEDPFVALGDDGAATVVFRAADSMFPRAWAARSSATGAWSAATVMGSGALPGLNAFVTTASNGDTVMTWTESASPSQTSLFASRNHAGTWSAPSLVSPDTGAVLGRIVVAADASGDVVASWSQRIDGIAASYALRSARMDGKSGTWSAPVTVNDGKREATGAALAVDAAGDAVAVWFEASYGVVASHFAAATSAWSSPVLLQAASGVVAFPTPTVGVDASGNAIATWVQPVGSPPAARLFAVRYSAASGVWAPPVDLLADSSATPFAAETQVAVGAKGEAVVVWRQDAGPASTPGIWARVYR